MIHGLRKGSQKKGGGKGRGQVRKPPDPGAFKGGVGNEVRKTTSPKRERGVEEPNFK